MRIPAPYKQTSHLALKFGKPALESLPPGIEYDGPLRVQQLQLEPHCFPQTAFDSIPYHGFAQSPGRGESHARTARVGAQTEGSEKGTRITRPLFVNPSEIAGTKNPDTFGKA